MKSMVKLLTVLILFVLTACEKKLDIKNADEGINENAIAKVISTENSTEQKSMYKLLNPFEKAQIWKNKFKNEYLNDDLTSDQKEFLISLQKFVTPEFFMAKKGGTKFDDRELKSTAIRLFGVSVAQSLLTNISQSKLAAGGGNSCKCSNESNWCGGNDRCDLGFCQFVAGSGCGTLWWYNCDGKCQVVPDN